MRNFWERGADIETERLRLRAWSMHDMQGFLLFAADPEVMMAAGSKPVLSADEALSSNVAQRPTPVVSVDGHVIADGRMGPVTRALQRAYHARVVAACGPTYFDAHIDG